MIAPQTGLDRTAVLWGLPLVSAGWAIAAGLKMRGVKGIGRKVDYGKVFDALRAKAQEASA